MTISERVYRLILKAYPAAYRREFGEPMVQLFRDQMRDCSTKARMALLWMRILADTARAAPAVHLDAVAGPGGWGMKSRTVLAVLASLLLLEAGRQVLRFTVFQISSPVSRVFLEHRPFDPTLRWVYIIGMLSALNAMVVVVALALFLIIMNKLSLGRMGRGAVVAMATAAAGGLFYSRIGMLRLLESQYAVVNWFVPVLVVAAFLLIMAKLGIGKSARCALAAVPVAAAVASSLAYRGVVQFPLITYTVVSALVLILSVAGVLLILRKLGLGWPARGLIAFVPAVVAAPGLLRNYDLLLFHEAIPPHIVLYFAGAYLPPICLAAAAWAANARGQSKVTAGPDETELPIPG